jgi:hypothetical protein
LSNGGSNKYLAAQLFSVSGDHTRRNKNFLEKYINNQNVGFNHLIAYEDYTESDLLKLCLCNPRLLQDLPYPESQKKEWLFAVLQNRAEGLKDVTIRQDFVNFMRTTIWLIPRCFKGGMNNQLCDSAIFLFLAQKSADLSLYAYPLCDQSLLSSAHIACLFVKYQGYAAYKLLEDQHQSNVDVLDLLPKNLVRGVGDVEISAPSRKIKKIKLFYEEIFGDNFFEHTLSFPPCLGIDVLNEFLTFTDRLRLSMVKKHKFNSVDKGLTMPVETVATQHFVIQ